MNKHEAALAIERIIDDSGLYGNPTFTNDAKEALYMGMDALEGKAVAPVHEQHGNMIVHWCGVCCCCLGASDDIVTSWMKVTKYCSRCGTRIKWEE